VISRGNVCWVEPASGPRVPVVVVQAEAFNLSRIPTVIVVPLAAQLRLAESPGNVRVPAAASRLGRDLVANVAQPLTIERRWVRETSARLSDELLESIAGGLALVLGLGTTG
jgi:mRNA interferase MazF